MYENLKEEISRLKIENPLKPYTSPKLYLYGDLREITRGNGTTGMLDAANIRKTSP